MSTIDRYIKAQEEEQIDLDLGPPPPSDLEWEAEIPMGEPPEMSPVTVHAKWFPYNRTLDIYRVEDEEGVPLHNSVWADHWNQMIDSGRMQGVLT